MGRYFNFPMATWKLCASTTLKFCYFQPVHCASKNPISPKIFNRFSKSLPQLKDIEGGRLCGKFTFAMTGWKLCVSKHLKFCYFQPVHCASKNPISPMVFSRFWKSLPQGEYVECGHLRGIFHVRRYFTFAMARWRLCAFTTYEILLLSTCTLCQQKSYISNGIQPIFEILASARRCWGIAFGSKVSGVQMFYFCKGKVKTLRIDTIWNFATFNLYTVPAKILYLQWYSTDFRNLCFCSKMLRECIWVEISGVQVFYFALARWKLCASTTFEILLLSTCTLCKQKSYISSGIQPIFEIFASARRCWGSAFGGQFHMRRILILPWQGENFTHPQHMKFCHFQPVHCPSKNPISPMVLNRFSKSLHQLEDVEGGNLAGKFHMRTYFTFAVARWNLWASTTFEILPLSTCTLSQEKSCISKGIPPIFEIFPPARRCWWWAFGWKVSYAQEFYFCSARVKTLPIDNFEILLLLTCTLCQQKSYISKDLRPIFEFFASVRRWWAWALGWKVSGVHVFYFCNGKVKTLRIDNIWNFAIHNLYNVPAKILCLQRHSTDFRNLCLRSKILRMGIWVESFICAGILLLQWQGENFARRQHLKFCNFQHVHCASKNPISPKIFNRFSKSLPQLKDIKGGHLGGKFHMRRYFSFAMAGWKLCPSTTFEILLLSTCTLCRQKAYICNGIQPILEIFASARRCWGSAFGWKVSGVQVFYFCNGKVKLCASTTFEILLLSTCTLCQQKANISNGIQLILEIFASARRCWGSAFGWKVSGVHVFYFCNGKVKLCASTTFEILPLSTCTPCQQKSYISKGIPPIFEIFASARRCWAWAFAWNFSCAQVF